MNDVLLPLKTKYLIRGYTETCKWDLFWKEFISLPMRCIQCIHTYELYPWMKFVNTGPACLGSLPDSWGNATQVKLGTSQGVHKEHMFHIHGGGVIFGGEGSEWGNMIFENRKVGSLHMTRVIGKSVFFPLPSRGMPVTPTHPKLCKMRYPGPSRFLPWNRP